MMNNFPNEVSYRAWKLMELSAKNNIKCPLGLISLLINCDPEIKLEETLLQSNNYSEPNLEA